MHVFLIMFLNNSIMYIYIYYITLTDLHLLLSMCTPRYDLNPKLHWFLKRLQRTWPHGTDARAVAGAKRSCWQKRRSPGPAANGDRWYRCPKFRWVWWWSDGFGDRIGFQWFCYDSPFCYNLERTYTFFSTTPIFPYDQRKTPPKTRWKNKLIASTPDSLVWTEHWSNSFHKVDGENIHRVMADISL